MSDFDSMSVATLQKLIDEERPKLQAPDAGTGKTHLNREGVLTEKVMIAQRLNRMAFFLKMRNAIASDDFAEITDECRPYLSHAATPVMESTRA
jgi:hypothetical protein